MKTVDPIVKVVVITKIYIKWAIRNPFTYLYIVLFFPLTILVPFLIIAPQAYLVDVIIGALLYSSIAGGISDLSQILSSDRDRKRLSFFLTRPVKPIEYLLGVALSGLICNIPGSFIALTIGVFLLGFNLSLLQILNLVLIIIVAWFTSSLLGFTIGLYGPKSYRMNSALANTLAFSLTFLAPIYYPIHLLPDFLRQLANILYTTHLAIMAKNVMKGASFEINNLIAVILFSVILLVLIIKGIKWREH